MALLLFFIPEPQAQQLKAFREIFVFGFLIPPLDYILISILLH